MLCVEPRFIWKDHSNCYVYDECITVGEYVSVAGSREVITTVRDNPCCCRCLRFVDEVIGNDNIFDLRNGIWLYDPTMPWIQYSCFRRCFAVPTRCFLWLSWTYGFHVLVKIMGPQLMQTAILRSNIADSLEYKKRNYIMWRADSRCSFFTGSITWLSLKK